ncbi:MAG: sulfite exporter TauE/SafE family protein [Akkermansiaceae bacterium]|nr:sulfite exporter TauE/SafE family protein [Akkermansiaceae bacterium]MDA7540859.1 sulfite exporter TauE/SafE family protein [bacterium]MDA7526703.1 sulfite exporter TauE/SafE family protein [Akkermansiaceae bacterium]MDA7673896.1 sulfite exporter TauE/SafE family protein [Akkermansiaceae bacterium]MDA7876180.1 sulfite exporter TauE/SafE family protein [Akkermansiaceae bacterium]
MIDSTTGWFLVSFAAMCVGLGKAGFSGLGLIAVFIMAELFGKASVGVLLPMLIVADVSVYPMFRKHASWAPVWRLVPPALVGMAIGFFLLDWMPEQWAKPVIGGIILFMVALQLIRQGASEFFDKLAHSNGFGAAAGSFAGIATTIANAAGPVFQLYFLARRLPKMELIGIGARFFLLINLIKLPFMGGLSFTTPESLLLNVKLVPLILIGIFLGRHLLQLISQRVFEWMIIGFAILAGVRLIWVG